MSHTRIALIIATMLIVMLLCAVIGVRQLWAIAALALLSLLWLLVDKLFEGPVLVIVTASHGLTAADLVGVAGLGVCGVLLLKRRRRRP